MQSEREVQAIRSWDDIPLHRPRSRRLFHRGLVHTPLETLEGLFEDETRLVRFELPGRRPVLLVGAHGVAAELLGRHWRTCIRGAVYTDVVSQLTGPGLLTTEGQVWASARRVMARGQASPLLPPPGSVVPDIVEGWLRDLGNSPFPLARQAQTLAWRVVMRWILAGDRQVTPELEDLLPALFQELDRCYRMTIVGLPAHPRPDFTVGVKRLNRLLARAVAISRRAPDPAPGFLSWAVHAPEASWLREGPDRLLTQLRTLVFAGLVTTSDALFWSLWLTLEHPDSADDLARQLVGIPATGIEQQRALVRPWIQESLRLFPPVWMMERESIAPIRMAKLNIPAGKPVAVFVHGAQRDPTCYPEPDSFRTSRTGEPELLAFTLGGHLCHGRDLALAELEVSLALLLRSSRLERVGPVEEVRPDPGLTLPPASSPTVCLTPRTERGATLPILPASQEVK